MGVHSGVAAPRNDNYVALAVHQAARIVSVAHGGQIVLSDTALQEVHHSPPGTTVALGRFRVRDFDKPELLHRLDPLLSSWSIGGQKLGQDIEALPGEGKFNEKTIVNMSFGVMPTRRWSLSNRRSGESARRKLWSLPQLAMTDQAAPCSPPVSATSLA
jgi:hypothetical protein